MIYVDNAATTKTSETAIKAMLPYLREVYGNPSSLHEMGQEAAEALLDARIAVANAINAKPNEIYFTSGGSESDNQAIMSCAERGERLGKKHIISSAIEHHAILHTLNKLKKRGFTITLLPAYENGIVKPSDLEKAITDDTALVTIMYANNEIGTIQPISELGKICRERKVPFHTDAVQAVGHIPVDVVNDNVDMLSISAHKFGGPKGVGALYVRNGVALSSFINGGAQERGKRAGTENIPAIVGMAAALKEAVANIETSSAYLKTLRDKLIDGLLTIPHSILNGDKTTRLPGNVNICFEGIEGEGLLLLLSDDGICASSGSACTSGSLDPSHVLLAIGRPHEIAHGSLRITLSTENTDDDVQKIIKSTADVVERLRSMSPVWKDLQEGKRNYVIQ